MNNKSLLITGMLLFSVTAEAKYKLIYKTPSFPTDKQTTNEQPTKTSSPTIGPKRYTPAKSVQVPVDPNIELVTMEPETVFACIKKYLPSNPIVLEAGSFDGNDTKKMAQLWPYGTIYAFEPVPENFANLEKNSSNYLNVQRFSVALSDKNGTAEFFNSAYANTPDVPSQSGSLLSPKEHLDYDHNVVFNKIISVPTITLDDWAQQNGVTRIDLLWLDMQGYELNVLKASPNILKTVKVIYTEVEFVEAYAGQYLYQDVRKFLEAQGFLLVARDFDEPSQYWFGNAIFVRK